MSRFKDSWGKAKLLLSQLLCVGAVFTACTDDEVINQTDKAPLQVSVNTSLAKQSRAIVHGEWLPSGSTIGVSLFDTEGDDYDGQGYYNIQYKAMGTEEDQVWSSMGVTPAVSANEAVLVAYHPYNDDKDLGIAAIPVEIASQTDYMYSGLVTGITNAAPKADIVLDHALTAIRIKLVLGDFTGDASVSEIAVASPALASSATLNAVDGSLNNITGQGDKFTLPVVFGLVASGTDNDIMFVPDASVESGVTTVSATIGGKKYTAGIEFDKAYKQGYIYTYTLTLNNSGFAVTKVNVNPWKSGNDDSAVLQPENDDAYIVEIDLSEEYQADLNFVHNIYGFIGTIDWGDGTTDTYTETTSAPSHIYNEYGKYTITAKGKMNSLNSYSSDVSKFITKLVRIGIDMGVESMSYAFYGQWLKDGFSAGALDGCSNITSFEEAFAKTGFWVIPKGLFDKCTEVTNFMGVFESSSIDEIPEGLFDNCTKVTSFDGTFWGTGITTIPEGLFDKCPEVTTFGQTFCNCEQLQAIPVGLFDNCTKVTSFGTTFCNCEQLQAIPEGLFDKCTEANYFYATFSGCNGLIDVPVGLFDYNIKVTHFSRTFWDCSSWIGESPYTIIQVDGVDTKVHLYERANYPGYFTKPKTGEDCFQACENLTDFNNIASNWK